MLARDDAAQRARERHDARDGRVRLAQHLVVVGVDRDVGVHVAVAGVHVQRDEHAAAQDLALDLLDARVITGANARPPKISSSGAFSSVFHDTTIEWSCSAGNVASMRRSRSCQRARTAATSARASSTFAAMSSGGGRASSSGPHSVRERRRRRGTRRARRTSLILFAIESSMLIRSMPSV